MLSFLLAGPHIIDFCAFASRNHEMIMRDDGVEGFRNFNKVGFLSVH